MRKLTALFLALVLLCSAALPTTALAVEEEPPETGEEPVETATGEEPALLGMVIHGELDEVTVELFAPEDATLLAAMYTESGQMIGFGLTELTGDSELREVSVALTMGRARPEYFGLRAFLVTGEHVPVCRMLYCFDYTKGYEEFMAMTPADFPGQTAIDGGDGDLVVLATGVLELSAPAHFASLTVDEETGTYTLTGAAGEALALQPGDVLWIVDENGEQHSVKVGSVSCSGDTVTITPDEDAEVSDFVSFIRVDVEMDHEEIAPYAEGAELVDLESAEPIRGNGAAPEAASAGTDSTDVDFKQNMKIGNKFDINEHLRVEIMATFAFEAKIKVSYSPDKLKSSGVYVKVEESSSTSITATVTGTLSNGEWKEDLNALQEHQLKLLETLPIPINPSVSVKVKVTVPVVLQLNGKAMLGLQAKTTATTVIQNGRQQEYSKSSDTDVTADLQVEALARVGLRISVEASILNILTIAARPEGGVELKAVLDPTVGPATDEKRHVCALCLKCELTPYVKVGISGWVGVGGLRSEKGKLWKVVLFDALLMDFRFPKKLFHWSSDTGFGWGSCKNFEYRVTVKVYGQENEALTDAYIKIYNMEDSAFGYHGMKDYLRPGEYYFTIVCNGYEPEDRTLTISHAQDVRVTMKAVGEEEEPFDGETITETRYSKYIRKQVVSYVILRPNGLMTFQKDEPAEMPYSYVSGAYPVWWQYNRGYVYKYQDRLNTIKNVVWLDQSMTELPDGAFEGAPQLKFVDMNGTAVSIGKNAFAYCAKLTGLTNAGSVTALGDNAFRESGVVELELNRVETVGAEAFNGCKDLKYVSLDGCTQIGRSTFHGCTSLEEVKLGSVTAIPSYAFYGCVSLASFEIPTSVTAVGDHAFDGSGLRNVSVPGSVEELGLEVFRRCAELRSATIDASITELPGMTFANCVSLTNVSLPGTLQTIGNGAFVGCTSLKTFVIPDSVTELVYAVFAGCASLEQIYIPAGLQQLDASHFDGCYMLARIDFGGTMDQWHAMIERTYNPVDTSHITVVCTDGVIEPTYGQ